MKGLRLFKWMNGKKGGDLMIASWHHPKSITWRWSIVFSNADFRVKPQLWNGTNGSGFYIYLWFRVSWQQNMFVKNPTASH